MNLSARTIPAIGEIITGDAGISNYRSGPKLVKLFNEYGSNDVYQKGFPSRWEYAESKLRQFNGSDKIAKILCEVLDPREFMNTEHEPTNAIEHINQRLVYDGYEVVLEGGYAKVAKPRSK